MEGDTTSTKLAGRGILLQKGVVAMVRWRKKMRWKGGGERTDGRKEEARNERRMVDMRVNLKGV
jgi:hypothetical protein